MDESSWSGVRRYLPRITHSLGPNYVTHPDCRILGVIPMLVNVARCRIESNHSIGLADRQCISQRIARSGIHACQHHYRGA
jgi:hypothetical protein